MGSFHQLTYHIVFGTKYRKPWIAGDAQPRLYEYIGGIIRGIKGHLIEIGGVADHVHILANCSPTIALSDAIRSVKANSSKWIHDEKLFSETFAWQTGYGAFTVSYSQVPTVQKYIQNQEAHHREFSFADVYTKLLTRHGIAFKREFLFEDEFHG
jgi:putative transposase